MGRPKGSKNKPVYDITPFLEVDPESAKERRLARQQEETVTTTVVQDPPIDEVKKRRLERAKTKVVKPAKPGKQWKGKSIPTETTTPNVAKEATEANKGAVSYFTKNWTVEMHDNKYVCIADGKKVMDFIPKHAGEINISQ